MAHPVLSDCVVSVHRYVRIATAATLLLGLTGIPSTARADRDSQIAVLVEGDGADEARRAVTGALDAQGQPVADPRSVAAARVFHEGPLDDARLIALRSELGAGALLAVEIRRQQESSYVLVRLVSGEQVLRRYDSVLAAETPATVARIAADLISASAASESTSAGSPTPLAAPGADTKSGVPAGQDGAIRPPTATPAAPPAATPAMPVTGLAKSPTANRQPPVPVSRWPEDAGARFAVAAVGGAKELSPDWGYLRLGAETGVVADLMDSSQVIGASAGVLFSRVRSIGSGVDADGFDIEEDTVLETWEPFVGARLAVPMQRVRPFLGGGGTVIGVRRSYRATPRLSGDPASAASDDRKSAVGFWFDGGLEVLLGRRMTASVRVRRSSARLQLQAREQDAGGWHALAAFGYAFGGRAAGGPPPGAVATPAPASPTNPSSVAATPLPSSAGPNATPSEITTEAPRPAAVALAPATARTLPTVTATPKMPPDPCRDESYLRLKSKGVARLDSRELKKYLDLDSACRGSGSATSLNTPASLGVPKVPVTSAAREFLRPSTAPAGTPPPRLPNPCEDAYYKELAARDLDALGDREYADFRRLDAACDAYRISAGTGTPPNVGPADPCSDDRYRVLRSKDLDRMTDAEYEDFQRLDAACIEQQRRSAP